MVTLDMNTILAVAAVVGIVVGAATLYQITRTHLIHDALVALKLGSKILRVGGLQLRAVAKKHVVKIKTRIHAGRGTVIVLWFKYGRRHKMHLMFSGQLKHTLLNGIMLNKPAHAALINVPLKQSMDASIIGQQSDLTVTPAIHGMVNEAQARGKEAYEIWVAQIAGELVHKPEHYAEHGFTVPWEEISQPFLKSIWTKDDPDPISATTDIDDLPF